MLHVPKSKVFIREKGGGEGGGSLRASSPFGSHAIFILGDIYLGLARDLGPSH